MTKPTLFLKIRTYPGSQFVSVWLCAKSGPAESGLMFGEVFPDTAEAILAATGLPVERDETKLAKPEPIKVNGCASVEE